MNNSGENMQASTSLIWSNLTSNGTINRHYDCYEKKRLQEEFEELGVLGEGGFGRVVLAKNKFDGMEYAVKMIPTTEEIARRIKNEIAALSQLEHENVVRYYGSWSEDVVLKKPDLNVLLEYSSSDSIVFEGENSTEENEDQEIDDESFGNSNTQGSSLPGEEIRHIIPPKMIYIQMEYCKKETLKKLIDTGTLSTNVNLLWWLFREITKGIEYIHTKNIIHGDIKPDNIFLTESYEKFSFKVKIGDFGLSTSLPAYQLYLETLSMHPPAEYAAGTLHYIAPEILRGEEYDQNCDLYSLGIVLFEMAYHCLTKEEALALFPPKNENFDGAFSESIFLFLLLRGLRSPTFINFPADFEGSDIVKKIITLMLQLIPGNRLSATKVLNLIPVTVDHVGPNQMFIIKELQKTGTSEFSRWLLDNIFIKEKSIAFPLKAFNNDNLNLVYHKHLIKTMNQLRNIFLIHGLHERIRDPLATYNDENLQSPVMDRFGRIFALSSDWHQDFALFSRDVNSFNSFAFGNFVSYGNEREYPKVTRECSVHMIAPIQHASFIEADLSSLIVDLMENLSILSGFIYTICISHAKIGEAIMDGEIQHYLNEYEREIFESNEVHPEKKMKIHELEENDINVFEKKLFTMLNIKEADNALINALKEMENFALNIQTTCGKQKTEIVFSSVLYYKPEIFADGISFTLEALASRSQSNCLRILAGGRYDQFLTLHRRKKDEMPLCAYGIDIFYQNFHSEKVERCLFIPHVLIYPGVYIKEAISLKNQFRINSYPASINYDENASVKKLKEICEAQCVPFFLMITNINEVVVYADTRVGQKLEPNDSYYYKAQMSYENAVEFIISTSPKN